MRRNGRGCGTWRWQSSLPTRNIRPGRRGGFRCSLRSRRDGRPLGSLRICRTMALLRAVCGTAGVGRPEQESLGTGLAFICR